MLGRILNWRRNSRYWNTELGLLALTFVIALASLLRFYNLRNSPGWYTDEGAFINVAANLLQGKWQYFALKGPMLVGRPPLFLLVLSGAFRLFGVDILILRSLTATCGVLSAALIFLTGREMFGAGVAFWSALFFAILPEAVAYNRIGFTYNLLAPLFVAGLYSSWKLAKTSNSIWGVITLVCAGLALATDYVGIVLVLLAWIVNVIIRPRLRWRDLFLLALPILIFLLLLPENRSIETYQDLEYSLLGRNNLDLLGQFVHIVISYGELQRSVVWIPLGMVGLFSLKDRYGRNLLLLVTWIYLLILVRAILPYGQAYYFLIPLLPLISFGVGAILQKGISILLIAGKRYVQNYLSVKFGHIANEGLSKVMGSMISVFLVFFVIMMPLTWMLTLDMDLFVQNADYMKRIGPVTYFDMGISSPEDINRVAEFLNSRISPMDVILTSAQLGWKLSASVADIQQLVVYEGEKAFALPAIQHKRFAFDCSLMNASYVVLDNLWYEWVFQMPDLKRDVEEVETWPVVFRSGEFVVYRNPLK